MSDRILLALCTCPDHTCAEAIANRLVEDGLAACVNILPAISSVYRWQGSLETSQESMLLIKTRSERYPEIERSIRKLHPYELPEVIAVSVAQGLPDYLRWIEQCTTSS